MHFYRSGTRHGIGVAADDLLTAGEGADATKRADLNALWHHAQLAMGQMARTLGRKEHAAFFLAWARNHHERCNDLLWDESRGRLFKALRGDTPEPGIEASQLLAVSLAPPLLDAERSAALVAAIGKERFTPYGLRPSPRASRLDPEWIGAFLTAYLRVHGRTPEAQTRCLAWLDALRGALGEVAALPEVFAEVHGAGGRGPRRAGGGVSILATAEVLRFWIEDLDVSGVSQPV
jgi:glycogen debranching enzyme